MLTRIRNRVISRSPPRMAFRNSLCTQINSFNRPTFFNRLHRIIRARRRMPTRRRKQWRNKPLIQLNRKQSNVDKQLSHTTKVQSFSCINKGYIIWAFPSFAKQTYRCRETFILQMRVGLSTISFALQKEGGQKDAVPIPNACEMSDKKMNFSFFRR